MVKGVSKTVIVVNDTGSKFFEKIVFYVTPEYGTLSAKQLKKAAAAFSFHYDEPSRQKKSLRSHIRRKRRIRWLLGAGIALTALIVALILLL